MTTGAPGRVLIADDEPLLREMLRSFLTDEGYAVVTVASGAEVLAAVPTFRPDVILLDMVMPGLYGRDVLDALRRDGVTVPVILMSGSLPLVEGGDIFRILRKPFNLHSVADGVAAAVNLRRGTE